MAWNDGADAWNPSATAAAPEPAWNGGDAGASDGNWGGDAGGGNDLSGHAGGESNGGVNDFAAGGEGAAGDDDSCRNCGQAGHFARECPEPKKLTGECYNCGEVGHNKADCTKPRVFRGACRICEQEGHPASECPNRPPDICRNCRQEGHKTLECTANRYIDLTTIPDKTPDEAWELMKRAGMEREMDDFRDAFKIYSKAVPAATLVDIERKLREEKMKVYLIALDKLESDVHVLVNLQGKLGCKYVVGFYFSEKPHRANLKDRWPASPEENLERLADAGFPMNRQVPKCSNCNELGHIARHCKQERVAIERVEIRCANCHEPGHRVRNCPQERVDRFACRNCGQPGHNARDCPEPRSAAGVECRICSEMGHFAKDCPQKPDRDDDDEAPRDRSCRNCGQEGHMARDCDQPRNMANVVCRNCEQAGHFSRDCTQRKDWSKVKCNTCGEMGHTSRRCPQAESDGSGSNGFGAAPGDAGGDAAASKADDGWASFNSGAGTAASGAVQGNAAWMTETFDAPAAAASGW